MKCLMFVLCGCLFGAETLLAQTAVIPPPVIPQNTAQSNVRDYHAQAQQNVMPSPDIPTLTNMPQGKPKPLDPQTAHDQLMAGLLAKKDYTAFQVEFEKHPEAKWAEALGWIYYRGKNLAQANVWFTRAASLNTGDQEAAYGLAMVAKAQGHLSAARSMALKAGPQSPKMRQLLNQIYAEQAVTVAHEKQFAKSLDLLVQAESLSPLNSDQRRLRAWDEYQLGQYNRSAHEFEALYRENGDSSDAQGLFLSLQRAGNESHAADLGKSLGGPLESMVQTNRAEEYYDRGLFLAAENTSPGQYPALKNIDSPSLDLGAALSQKSGQSGLSKLDAARLPFAEGSIVFSGVDELLFEASRLDLNSDSMAPHDIVGTYPVAPTAYSHTPTTHLDDLMTLDLLYVHQGWFTPYAELGTTPINGPLSVLPTGRLGFVQQTHSGNWGLSLYSESNTESILSYAGMRDPYGGRMWGRVIESGVNFSGYQDLGSDWGINGTATAGYLVGDQVETNQHDALSVGIGRDLKLEDFRYFVIGPDFFAEHFEHNLSGFTIGQGGYFSPEYLAQAALGLHFLTLEGQQFIVRGNFDAGLQTNKQAQSPYFPLSPDGRNYGVNNNSSFVGSAQVEGVVRISDHWQFGAALSYAKSADYDDTTEMAFFRFLFEPRPAVFSSDFVRVWP